MDAAIEFIEQHPMLWDTWDDQWINYKLKAELWKEVADMCSKTVEEMKRWWKTNRDEWNRMHGIKEQSGAAAVKPRSNLNKWRWQKIQFYGRSAFHRFKKSDPLVKIPLKPRVRMEYIPPTTQVSNSSNQEEEEEEDDEDADDEEVVVLGDDNDSVGGTQPGVSAEGSQRKKVKRRVPKKKGTMTSQLLDALHEFMRKAEMRQKQMLKPATVKEGYGMYISAWLCSLSQEDFNRARKQLDNYIKTFNTGRPIEPETQSADIIRQAARSAEVPENESSVDDVGEGLARLSNPTHSRSSRSRRAARSQTVETVDNEDMNVSPSPRFLWPTNWQQNVNVSDNTASVPAMSAPATVSVGPTTSSVPPMSGPAAVPVGANTQYMAPDPHSSYHPMQQSADITVRPPIVVQPLGNVRPSHAFLPQEIQASQARVVPVGPSGPLSAPFEQPSTSYQPPRPNSAPPYVLPSDTSMMSLLDPNTPPSTIAPLGSLIGVTQDAREAEHEQPDQQKQ